MNEWSVILLPEARKDLDELDSSVSDRVLKAIRKVSFNPLPRFQGGFGDPLSNHNEAKLAGLCKVKLKRDGIRVVYKAIEEDGQMVVIVIGARADDAVYREAERRRKRHGL